MKPRKILKSLSVAAISCAIITGMTGCMQKNKLSVSACVSYMKEKYGTDFTLVEKGELTSSTLEIYVESPEYKGEKILLKYGDKSYGSS